MKNVGYVCLALMLLGAGKANGQERWLLWGSLQPGPHRVGLRTTFLFDASRTWKTTRPYKEPFSPDRNGRPIRLDVWYPAAAGAQPLMRFRDYIEAPAPKGFADLQNIIAQRDRLIVSLDVPGPAIPALSETRVNAIRNAPAAPGRFPVLLYFGGLNDAATLNACVLAEFLASYGYLVATVAPIGSTEDEPDQLRTAVDLESTVRDMEFAWSTLRHEKSVDPARLAVLGHSVGGIEAVIFAMRNQNATAVVGLDGTYHFAGATRVLTDFYSYVPKNFAAALLDLRRTASDDIDLTPVQALRHSDRELIALPKMHHSDFTAFAMLAERFHLGNTPGYVDTSGWTRATGYDGYQAVCRIVRDYLDETLRNDSSARDRLTADVRNIGGSSEHIAAAPAPPSIRQLASLVGDGGFEAGKAIVDELSRTIEGEEIVEERPCNALGYELIAEKRFEKGITIFRLCAYTHPASANAQDSLGEGYLAAGQEDLAGAAYERASELAPNDAAIRPEQRKAFSDDERKKAQRLRPAQ